MKRPIIYHLTSRTIGNESIVATICRFLFADAASLFFVVVCILLFFASTAENGRVHLTFWIFLVAGCVYTIVESSAFAVFVQPYAERLPNATERLLDRAIPFNSGGLLQIEDRLGCTFNHNLYNTFQRKTNNPRVCTRNICHKHSNSTQLQNTCDPLILSSFISSALLVAFVVLRIVPIALCAAIIACGRPCGEPIGRLAAALRPKAAYKTKYVKNTDANKSSAKKSKKSGKKKGDATSTTFDAADKRAPPIISSPSSLIDHTLRLVDAASIRENFCFNTHFFSYNNAAYFAVAGAHSAPRSGSSRSSHCDVADLYPSR